jgi:tetratricopeptide (TPR) repeat protein
VDVAEFDSFAAQDELSGEMKNLALVSLELSRVWLRDYDAALVRLNDVLPDLGLPRGIIGTSDVHRLKGTVLNELAQCEEAVRAFNQSLALAQSAQAYNNRGFAHRRLGMIEAAIQDYALIVPTAGLLRDHRACT